MAWTSPKTFVSNAILTADELNTHLTANLLECAPAKATAAGSMFVGAGPNAITENIPKMNTVDAAEGTASTSFVNLDSVGPSVTVTTNYRVLIIISAAIANTTLNSASAIAYEISGATTQAPLDALSLVTDGISADKVNRRCIILYEENLNPGENTFTLKYRVGSGTATYQDRFLGVWPF